MDELAICLGFAVVVACDAETSTFFDFEFALLEADFGAFSLVAGVASCAFSAFDCFACLLIGNLWLGVAVVAGCCVKTSGLDLLTLDLTSSFSGLFGAA